MIKIYSSFIFILLGHALIAQTYLPKSLFNYTLKFSFSPFIADSTLFIDDGCILKAEPAIEIRMCDTCYIIVEGSINFSGTASKPIIIHAKDSIWSILYFDETLEQ